MQEWGFFNHCRVCSDPAFAPVCCWLCFTETKAEAQRRKVRSSNSRGTLVAKSGMRGQLSCIPVFFLTILPPLEWTTDSERGKKNREEKKKKSYSVQVMFKTGTEYRVPLHPEFPILVAIGKGNTGSLCQKWAHFQFPKLTWMMDLLLEGPCAYFLEIVIFLCLSFIIFFTATMNYASYKWFALAGLL